MTEGRRMGRGEEDHYREGLERLPEQRGHFPCPPAPGGQTSLASLSLNRFSKKVLDCRTCQKLQRTDTPLQF